MASSFAELRAKQGNALDKIKQKVEEQKGGGGSRDSTLDDPTYWNPIHVRGKDGTGEAIIRFLPATNGEDDPYVRYIDYAYEGPGGWYINRSRQTLGKNEKDPAYEYCGDVFKAFKNGELTEEQRNKKLFQRKENFTANILVISDPNMPENEGKVLKWKFGAQIFGIINSAMFPEFQTQTPINPFDPVEGANFHFRVYTKKIPDRRTKELKAVPSYDKSSFAAPSPMFDDLSEFDAIWNQQHPLQPIVAPEQFKSYEELLKDFNRAMDLEKKSFLDTDEPLTKTAAEPAKKAIAKAKEKPAQTTEELLDDEIPEVEEKTTTTASEFDDADDDWFNDLKK